MMNMNYMNESQTKCRSHLRFIDGVGCFEKDDEYTAWIDRDKVEKMKKLGWEEVKIKLRVIKGGKSLCG